jgi:hypothetical protein
MKRNLYRTEIWSDKYNDWMIIKMGKSCNEEYFITAAEVYSKSRNCDSRVICNGNIIFNLCVSK